LAGSSGFPDDRGLVAALRQLPVQAVHAGVELAVGEPADVEVVRVEAGVLDLRERPRPFQPLRDATPETVGVAHRLGVIALVAGGVDARGGRKVRRHRMQVLAHGRQYRRSGPGWNQKLHPNPISGPLIVRSRSVQTPSVPERPVDQKAEMRSIVQYAATAPIA
jgi:hypothetical protein